MKRDAKPAGAMPATVRKLRCALNNKKPRNPSGLRGFLLEVVRVKGLEPPTPSLRMTCSTS